MDKTDVADLAGRLEEVANWLRAKEYAIPDDVHVNCPGTVFTLFVHTAADFHRLTFAFEATVEDPSSSRDYVYATRIFGPIRLCVAAKRDNVCTQTVTGVEVMPDGRRVEVFEWRLIDIGGRS